MFEFLLLSVEFSFEVHQLQRIKYNMQFYLASHCFEIVQ